MDIVVNISRLIPRTEGIGGRITCFLLVASPYISLVAFTFYVHVIWIFCLHGAHPTPEDSPVAQRRQEARRHSGIFFLNRKKEYLNIKNGMQKRDSHAYYILKRQQEKYSHVIQYARRLRCTKQQTPSVNLGSIPI
jgi:hypothetical protein